MTWSEVLSPRFMPDSTKSYLLPRSSVARYTVSDGVLEVATNLKPHISTSYILRGLCRVMPSPVADLGDSGATTSISPSPEAN
jgi:hypothetical protein